MSKWKTVLCFAVLVAFVFLKSAYSQSFMTPSPHEMSKERWARDIWLLKAREEIVILQRIADESPARRVAIEKRIQQIEETIKTLDSTEKVEDYRRNRRVLELPNSEMLDAARLLEALGADVYVSPSDFSNDILGETVIKKGYVISLHLDEENWIGTPDEIDRAHKVLPIVGLYIKANKNPSEILTPFALLPTAKTIYSISIESRVTSPTLLSQIAEFALIELAISNNNLQIKDYSVLKRMKRLKLLLLYGRETVSDKDVKLLQENIGPIFIYSCAEHCLDTTQHEHPVTSGTTKAR